MRIVLNGERYPLDEGATVAALVDALALKGRRIAVEVNEEVVPRSRHAAHHLKDGDRVEVVHAIGGG
jgi:sulfur carrier protein